MKKNLIILIIVVCVLILLFFYWLFNSKKTEVNKFVNFSYEKVNLNLIEYANKFEKLFELKDQTPLNGKILGSVQKLKRLPNGNFYLIDAATKHLNIFNKDGKFLRMIGGIGKGPGEYIKADDFDSDSIGIYILDGSLMRVIIFDALGNYKGTIKTDEFVNQIVSVNNRIYLYSTVKMLEGAAGFCYNTFTGIMRKLERYF